jgi:hypothetical protein
MQYCALGSCEGRCVVALSDEPSCSDSEPGDTCDGECRCEYCWDPEPTDAEVIADLRAKLKMRDVQLQQQNEQCQILLAKLAEVRRERDERVPTDLGNGGAFTANVKGALCEVSVWYPRQIEQETGDYPSIVIDLIDVRAADYLGIQYDFDRDGWVILQQPGIDRGAHVETVGSMKEVAFVQSWALVEKAKDVAK